MAHKWYQSEKFMRRRYVTQGKTPEQIAEECGVGVVTIYNHLNKMGLLKTSRSK